MRSRGLLRRALALWLVLMAAEVAHGIARTVFLAPIVGDFRARQIAVFTGSLLILLIATSTIGWLRPANAREATVVGLVWLVLTVCFEIAFGRYVAQVSWSRIAADFNLLRGGLLPLGLLVLAAAPFIAMRIRRVRDAGPHR